MTALQKFEARVTAINSLVSLGLDTDRDKIPDKFLKEDFPLFEFNKYVIKATHQYAAAYTLDTAFYEAEGANGFLELEITMEHLRDNYPDILLIGDAKCGDESDDMEQYAKSLFDHFGFDAVTVHPYLGSQALMPFLERKDKATIVVCHTANAGAGELQDLLVEKLPLWEVVAKRVRDDWNKNGNCMLVAGATSPEDMKDLRGIMGEMTFLVPDPGKDGDIGAAIRAGLNSKKLGLIVNSSHDIIYSPDPAAEAKKLRDEINMSRT